MVYGLIFGESTRQGGGEDMLNMSATTELRDLSKWLIRCLANHLWITADESDETSQGGVVTS